MNPVLSSERKMRIILFTGRGGSGVSTIAAATSVALANAGQRTLAFGLGSGLSDALSLALTHEPREVAPNLLALETRHGDDEPDEVRDWLEGLLDWRGGGPGAGGDPPPRPRAEQNRQRVDPVGRPRAR